MARRVRRETPDGEYQDPLKNYDPPQYDDALEQALEEQTVTAMRTTPIAQVTPSTSIEDAMRLMAKHGIACVLVVEDDRLLGLISERDILHKVAERFEDLRTEPVTRIMTPEPLIVHETDSPGTALNLMAVQGFRHVPILNVDEKLVGIIGPRRITEYLQSQVASQAK